LASVAFVCIWQDETSMFGLAWLDLGQFKLYCYTIVSSDSLLPRSSAITQSPSEREQTGQVNDRAFCATNGKCV
jgi:hypothetical protein